MSFDWSVRASHQLNPELIEVTVLPHMHKKLLHPMLVSPTHPLVQHPSNTVINVKQRLLDEVDVPVTASLVL